MPNAIRELVPLLRPRTIGLRNRLRPDALEFRMRAAWGCAAEIRAEMHRILGRVAQWLAGLGLLLGVMSVVLPIPPAVALALCLPWCQVRRGHFVLERPSRDWHPTRLWLLEALGAVLTTLLLLTLAGYRLQGWLAGDGIEALVLVLGLGVAAMVAFWQAALLLAARVAMRPPARGVELS